MIITPIMSHSPQKEGSCVCARSSGAACFVAFLAGIFRRPLEAFGRMITNSALPTDQRREWEHFPHDADVGLRGWGATPAEAFEQAAYALTAVVTQAEVNPKVAVRLTREAPDLELLFVEWLNAIIYEMAVRNMLFGRFSVRIENHRLEGTLWGEPVDVARHAPACEPKGATYTALKVVKDADGRWSAACIVDV